MQVEFDKAKVISYSLNMLLLLLLCGTIYWHFTTPCPPCFDNGQTVIVHDTIRPADKLEVIAKHVPVPIKIKPKPVEQVLFYDEPNPSTVVVVGKCLAAPSPCDSVYYYADSIYRADDMRAVIRDTLINNRIAGRSVLFANLKPEVSTTTTVVKREKWKLYVGGDITYNVRNTNRWGAGPAASLAIPKIGAINYYYDARNNAHTAGFVALVRLKK